MEKEILTLMRAELLSAEDSDMVLNAIENGDIDACDLFDDFVTFVSENADIDYKTLMDYKEHYQNLLSHKENLLILLNTL